MYFANESLAKQNAAKRTIRPIKVINVHQALSFTFFLIQFSFYAIGSLAVGIQRKREPTMPRPNLKALRKPVSRYNNSSPRYTRENHYAILAQ